MSVTDTLTSSNSRHRNSRVVTTEKYNKARNELQALKTMRDEWAKKQREWEKERQTA